MQPSEQLPEPRYTNVLAVAQHGPEDGKSFFAFVMMKITWGEYANNLHHKIAQAVLVEQGCAAQPMVVCDIGDLPEFLKMGLAAIGPSRTSRGVELPAFEAEPRHYEEARRDG